MSAMPRAMSRNAPRPVATAVHAADPENTWEISHSGGHRFAGVLLALPEGLVYGRVAAAHVPELVAARARGELVPGLLRGRAFLGEPEQAAQGVVGDGVRPDDTEGRHR